MTAPAPVTQRVTRHVAQVSGKVMQVMTNAEAEWYEETRDAYMLELKFTEKTDLIDLDRLLILELMIFRWSQHLAAGIDYDGDMVNEKQLTADIKAYSDQLNKIKDSMGLTKKARDDIANADNFAQKYADLKARAKMFGIHRETQLTKTLTLGMELSTVVGAFDRSDEEERRKLGFEDEKEIVAWIRETWLPEFHAQDEYFRTHSQRYWIRDM